jgi:hypothetical protein
LGKEERILLIYAEESKSVNPRERRIVFMRWRQVRKIGIFC